MRTRQLMVETQNPYSTPVATDDHQSPTRRRQHGHSALGTASLVTGIVAVTLLVGLFAATVVVEQAQAGAFHEDTAVALLIGLGFIATGAFSFVGIGLGIAGMIQSRHRRSRAISGLVLNLLIAVAFAGLALVGITAAV